MREGDGKKGRGEAVQVRKTSGDRQSGSYLLHYRDFTTFFIFNYPVLVIFESL